MKRITLTLLVALTSIATSQIAYAQSSPPTQNSQSLQASVQQNLKSAGFTDIHVMPSSFLVRAKDKDGNPVMMVINPDSVTAISELSPDQNESESSAAGSTSGGRLNLTEAQRDQIRQNLGQSPDETTPASFTPQLGETLPTGVTAKSLPSSVSSKITAIKTDEYAMVQNQILIVDPSSKKILAIVSK